MADTAAPVFYRAMQTAEREWTVFLLDAREPEWWRVLARFPSQERAESYAEIETMMNDDGESSFKDVGAASPAILAPASAITVANFSRRETVTHTRIEREETVQLGAPEIEAAEEVEGEVEISDCADLPTLNERQAKVFAGIRAIVERGERATMRQAALEIGSQNVTDAIYALEKKGYLAECGERGARHWVPCAEGEPRVDSLGLRARPWSDAEFLDLEEVAKRDGDFAALALRLDRSEGACKQQAYLRGWCKISGERECLPAAVASQEPQLEPDEVDADDLSKTPREVLCVIAELYDDKIHPIKEADILAVAEADEGRLPMAITRLSELNCIRRDGAGSWFPTSRGQAIAKQSA
jgi:hypothetical protein